MSTAVKRFDARIARATALDERDEATPPSAQRTRASPAALAQGDTCRSDHRTGAGHRRERRDELAVAGDLSNLGNILLSMSQHQRGLTILEEALAMPVVGGDPIKRAYILHLIANAYRAAGHLDRALAYLQRADESARAHRLPIQRSFHLTSMAHIHLQTGRLDDSLRLYHEAFELSRRARHAHGLAQALRILGRCCSALTARVVAAAPEEAAALFGSSRTAKRRRRSGRTSP